MLQKHKNTVKTQCITMSKYNKQQIIDKSQLCPRLTKYI